MIVSPTITPSTQGGGTGLNEGQEATHQGSRGYGSFQEHVEDVYAERRRKNIILRGIPEYRWAEDEDIIYDVLT